MKRYTFLAISALFLFCACSTGSRLSSDDNPPASGFDIQNSDAKAIQIADQVMKAMGGRKAYDETRYLKWNFFGSRIHVWDKHKGDVSIHAPKQDIRIKMNIHSNDGRVWLNTVEQTHPDSLSKYLERGKSWWINDSYWIVMPYKLKDSGVTLTYIGEDNVHEPASHKLQMTFKGVGVTPQNKYHIYVDKESHLVNRWDYFPSVDDVEPRFTIPWRDYKSFGNILLSGDRDKYQISEIEVGEQLAKVFQTK